MSQLEMLMGAAGAGGGAEVNWIDDVFSTWLYTGTNANQTITNGIDLVGKGGMVWTKPRNTTGEHELWDTTRGVGNYLVSNTTAANVNLPGIGFSGYGLTSFNTNGFSLGLNWNGENGNGNNLCSWTFAEQEKFFDVVTYTGDGNASKTISHNLGSTPGMIIVKKTSATSNWIVWAIANGTASNLRLNTTGAATSDNWIYNPTSTQFVAAYDFGSGAADSMNDSGETYVAYLFASNAGGFGAAGTDNVISCGSFTTDGGGNATVNLGYEPQYLLVKQTNASRNWWVVDSMRGFPVESTGVAQLNPNTSGAESIGLGLTPNATGFNAGLPVGTYIYMAIRRPMKPPTSGTEVFLPILSTSATGTQQTTNFPVDLQISTYRDFADNRTTLDRLRGVNTTSTIGQNTPFLSTNLTSAETANTNLGVSNGWNNTGFRTPTIYNGYAVTYFNFRRASGFFDVVCYTGTGASTRAINHNLNVTPQLIIIKNRSQTGGSTADTNWVVNAPSLLSAGYSLFLNTTGAEFNWSGIIGGTVTGSSSTFSLTDNPELNRSSQTYVTYLFATLAGVSKVGSYTGNGGTQAIACGFTGGARFVLIKRTDATGDWYVYDTARGMTLLTDPYLLLNSTAAESATLGSVTTTTGGFTVDATVLAAINTNAASYIFLAIA